MVATQAVKQTLSTKTKPSLRVLFVSHTYVVGINQGKLDAIAKTESPAQSVTVGLLVPSPWKAKGWKQIFNLEKPHQQIQYFPSKVILNGRTGAYLYSLWNVLRAIRQFQPNLLQVEEEVFSLSTFQIAILSRILNIPMVVFGWENQDRNLTFLRQWIRRFVLDTTPLIIAGNRDGEQLLRKWGYTGTIEVMPQMGVDMSLFDATARQRNTDDFLIGYMGRLVNEKGIDLLFKAARQLHERGHQFRVILCGSGQDEATLRQAAEQEGVADLITWKGKVPHADVPLEMNQFDVLVLPSRTMPTWKEQFGHVLIEAMSMGLPVVGSTSGEIPNVIGRTDLVFPENDDKALAAILERMIQQPNWYAEVSQYGIDRVKNYYTHERIAERLIERWTEVLNHRK
jgi:glycosyltransferase involved in cell wall biosynthesis